MSLSKLETVLLLYVGVLLVAGGLVFIWIHGDLSWIGGLAIGFVVLAIAIYRLYAAGQTEPDRWRVSTYVLLLLAGLLTALVVSRLVQLR